VVTPKTGRRRGRPRYNFFADPERFAVAFLDALMALDELGALKVSEGDAFKTAAVQIVGVPMELKTVEPRRKRGRGPVPGGTNIAYDGRGPATIAGKADTLRRKYKRSCPPEVAAWRLAMARGFMLALTGRDRDRCAAEIARLAASVGEASYATAVLLPMLAAKKS
jgi:hypothetical protein